MVTARQVREGDEDLQAIALMTEDDVDQLVREICGVVLAAGAILKRQVRHRKDELRRHVVQRVLRSA